MNIKVEFVIPHASLSALQNFIEKECPNVSNPNPVQSTSGASQASNNGAQAEKSAQPSAKPGRPTKAEKEAKEKAEKERQEKAAAESASQGESEAQGDEGFGGEEGDGWGDESDDDKPLTPDQRSKLMVALKAHSKANSFDETKALLKKISGTNDPAKVTRGYFDALMKALA